MARKSPAPRKSSRTSSRGGRDDRPGRRKPCIYCKHEVDAVDYKQHGLLRGFVSDKGKIRSRRVTYLCRRHQVQMNIAVKRAREVALLPYLGQQ